LPARACFVPPEIGVSNDLTRLWKRKRHPLAAVRSFHRCNELLQKGSRRCPVQQALRR
jgi:hypothetical protein